MPGKLLRRKKWTVADQRITANQFVDLKEGLLTATNNYGT